MLTSTRPETDISSMETMEQTSSVKLKVAYIMSRFPKLTETFILYEMLAVERQGVQIELYPLLRARSTATHPEGASMWLKIIERFRKPQGTPKMHPEAKRFMERAHFLPFFSWPILKANFYYLIRKPLTYFSTIWTLIRTNWGSLNYLLGTLSIFPKVAFFARQMTEEGIKHIHAHFANHPAAAAFIINRLTDISYSFTAHGADLQVDQHMLCEKVSNAAFVVTISNYNKEIILKTCGKQNSERIKVIHCGVDTNVFSPDNINFPEPSNNGRFSILCTGTMYEVKGHTYLIEACRLLKEQGLDFACYLVGDGPDRGALSDQVEQSGLSNHVFFQGQRTRMEISDLLKRVDVAVVPSIPTSNGRREGIPVVLMEAMSSSVPVVASDISGIPELVEHEVSGLLVEPRNPRDLALALKQILDNPQLRQRLGQSGREKILREFDLYTNAATLVDLFGTVRNS
jgi:colanic acid/amylovoran biosynthesis glycosyltransferase